MDEKEKQLIAKAFLMHVHGKNANRITSAEVQRVMGFLSWSADEIYRDWNRNRDAWEVRLFAAGVELGKKCSVSG